MNRSFIRSSGYLSAEVKKKPTNIYCNCLKSHKIHEHQTTIKESIRKSIKTGLTSTDINDNLFKSHKINQHQTKSNQTELKHVQHELRSHQLKQRLLKHIQSNKINHINQRNSKIQDHQ